MKVYEYTQDGFNGGCSDTDHCVKWIAAPSEEVANVYAWRVWRGAEMWGEVDEAAFPDDATPAQLKEHGVDVVLDANGREMQ